MIVTAYSGGQPKRNCARLSFAKAFIMNNADLFRDLVATYQKHGWKLRRAMLQPATRADLESHEEPLIAGISMKEDEFDALWFSRPSSRGREAWELRLMAQTQYALFEAFDPDVTEEAREEVRLEMESRLRDYCAKSSKS